jgi:ribose transport system ATP-binding protein
LPSSNGQIILQEETYDLSRLTPQVALKADIALLPGDRQNDGSVGSLTVGENVSLQVLDRYFNNLHLSNSRMLVDAKSILHQFGVRPNDPTMNYQQLSGGNQQKALIAKWFRTEPKLLLLHEPTRGVDVGARRQIFTIIRDAAKRGACIICASSDFDEVIAICDRLLIFRRGRIRQQLTGDNITRDRVYEYSVGGM